METISIKCAHCGKEHGIRTVHVWLANSDQYVEQTQIEEAEFFDTETLNKHPQFKADLEEEYKRPADFVVGPYTGWCLRSAA
ncbi:MAG: hypothetical protein RBR16_12785 [Syntrophus sp. (in: bacteria)]|nr:hypothetical protein [Syntrophus sp. (in: bacteria)]